MGTSKSFGSSRQSRLARLSGPIVALATIISMILAPAPVARAATSLTVTPITWNVIGLDSNNVNVGPNDFPIGARVCNTSGPGETLTDVTANFVWDSTNLYIDRRPGTSATLSIPTLPQGSCTDFYFEVEVTRTPAAYDTTRAYHIAVTANGNAVTGSTPMPRALYVEHLISQSRNNVSDIKLNGVSVSAGGTMSLMVGNTYNIQLDGKTATNGYEQIESFLTLQNTIFRINSVATTYTATPTPPPPLNDPDALTKPYANSCGWENDPSSLNYRSCLSTGKYGGDITVTYNVTVIAGAGTTQSLNSLIYDFSGSSYHYNADYGVAVRFAKIVNAGIVKSFAPKAINPFGTSTLTFTINNPGAATLTGVKFVDNLPAGVPSGQMSISSSAVTYNGCGSAPSPASLTVGATSLSFTDIEVAGLGTCAITINVTASIDATYNNTSGHLFINNTTDTGSFATDSLVVSSKPAAPSSCASPSTMATWSLENYTASTSTNNGPFSAFPPLAPDVSAATATYGAVTGSSSGIAYPGPTPPPVTYPTGWSAPSTSGNSGNSWGIKGGWLQSNPATPATATTPYFQFQVDASNYGGIGIAANYNLQANWSNSGNWYVLYSADGVNWSSQANGVWNKSNAWQVNGVAATTTATGNAAAYFRVYAAGAQYGGNPSETTGVMYLDSIRITGCPRPVLPTLSKSFLTNPIARGSVSTLRFILANPNATALTGVGFSDALPTGLLIATPNGLTTPSCSQGSLTGGTTTATEGTSTISLSGATLSANANCTISVDVLGNVAGQYTNTSGNITSTETGPNTTSTGYGTSSLTVIAPPVIAKSFAASPILTGNATLLKFTISNPNASTTLNGIGFTDTLPAGLDVVASSGSQCGGTLTVSDNSPTLDTISLSGGSLAAGGSCSFDVTVTATTIGLKSNSVTVSSTNGGTGNTSTANVLVKDPAPAIKLLKQVGTSATGPWTSFLNVSAGADVYYRFTVENMGDVALSPVSVTDPTLAGTAADLASCSWPNPLPVASPTQDPTAICVTGPISAAAGAHPNTASASGTYTPLVGQPVNVTSTSTATYYTGQLALDFGDIPDTSGATGSGDYQTLLANNGPRHLLTDTLYLGACVDSEADGQQNGTATGDNTNLLGAPPTLIGTCGSGGDEDGVARNMSEKWTPGATVQLNVTVVGEGEMACWIDWNGSGNLGDNTNKFINIGGVPQGGAINVTIPNDGSYALGRALYVRCRLFPTGEAPGGTLTQDDYIGYATGGEVEDYYWTFNATAVTLRDLQATTMSTGERLMELLRFWLQR